MKKIGIGVVFCALLVPNILRASSLDDHLTSRDIHRKFNQPIKRGSQVHARKLYEIKQAQQAAEAAKRRRLSPLRMPMLSIGNSAGKQTMTRRTQVQNTRVNQRPIGVFQARTRNLHDIKKMQQDAQPARRRATSSLARPNLSALSSVDKYIAMLETQGRYRRLSQRTKSILQARDRRLFEEKNARQTLQAAQKRAIENLKAELSNEHSKVVQLACAAQVLQEKQNELGSTLVQSKNEKDRSERLLAEEVAKVVQQVTLKSVYEEKLKEILHKYREKMAEYLAVQKEYVDSRKRLMATEAELSTAKERIKQQEAEIKRLAP